MTQDNTQMVELLPCPFCGRQLVLMNPSNGFYVHPWKVDCILSDRFSFWANETSLAAWNTRHTPKPATEPAHAKEQAAGVERCSNCDGTGDLIRLDGEYMGPCPCAAAPSSSVTDSAPATGLREALDILGDLSSYLGAGMGDDATTAQEYDRRIRWGIDHIGGMYRNRAAEVVEECSKRPGTTWGKVKRAILDDTALPTALATLSLDHTL